MRNFIDLFKTNPQPLKESVALTEFVSKLAPRTVVSMLQDVLHQHFYQVGGPGRVYDIDGGMKGTVYVVGKTALAIGLGWKNGEIASVFVWRSFSINKAPEYEIVIPSGIDFSMCVPTIARLILKPVYGKVPIETDRLHEAEMGKRRSGIRGLTVEQFLNIVVNWASKNGKDIRKISSLDLAAAAEQNGVSIPVQFRLEYLPSRKVDANHYNLGDGTTKGGSGEDVETKKEIEKELGGEIEDFSGAEGDKDVETLVGLSRVKSVRNLLRQNKLFVTGRKSGKFFSYPRDTFDAMLATLERLYAKDLEDKDEKTNKSTMETEYELLTSQVRLIASGESNFVKALLITGSPSSGKSYNVLQTIKSMGLKEGQDYILKKGYVTVSQAYRILIEQSNNGLVVFDDCDSIVTSGQRGINMLKGALDTDAVREVSNEIRGAVSIDNRSKEVREKYVSRLSELLRGARATQDDVDFYKSFVPYRAMKVTSTDAGGGTIGHEDETDDVAGATYSGDDTGGDVLDAVGLKIIEYVLTHLPNKIDFKGRVIFISNMNEDEWDDAILSRTLTVNISFDSSQMLEYIEKVVDNIHIQNDNLSKEQKLEVLEYLRQRHALGKVKRPINFRLVQQAFDLRLTPQWKELINRL